MKPIVLSQIKKAFGEQQVLKGVSLILEPGRLYCLMGPSGAGKTTLLRVLMGLEQPDSGSISGLEDCRISVSFQEDRLLERENAVENVALVCDNKENEEGLRQLLWELLPGEDLEKPVSSYSGGMKRRVSLCRAVAADSELLLLDEPFSGLDEETRQQAARFLLKHRNGRTVVVVTHQTSDAELLGAEILYL